MGSGIEVVVLSFIVGLVGFWLGWKMRWQQLTRVADLAAAPDSSGRDALVGTIDHPVDSDKVVGSEAWYKKKDEESRAMRVDFAALHFAAALAGGNEHLEQAVDIVMRARALADVFVAAESKASRRSPFYR